MGAGFSFVPEARARVRRLPIPLFHHASAVAELLPEIADRQSEVLRSGRYVLGPELASFEQEFADYLGVSHCIGVGNGTDALTIALRALGIGSGDEVVVPAVTFYATAEAVINAGARPVFADVDDRTWCLTPKTVEPVLSPRTAAILPVHLFGNPAPVDELRALADGASSGRRIVVVEDAAQAAGATLKHRMAGALADAATFSFYPSKNLGAVGDAGAIVTGDREVAEACRRLRTHGSADKKLHTEIGYNSRLDELQAVALRIFLPRLDSWTAARREVALAYQELGLGELVDLPVETAAAESCYHLFVVTSERRDQLAAALEAAEVESRVYYTPPLHKQPALTEFAPSARLPGAERFERCSLALPMGPALGREQIARVVEAARGSLTGTPSSEPLVAG